MAKNKFEINKIESTSNELTLSSLSKQVENTDFEIMQSFDNVLNPLDLKKKQHAMLEERKEQLKFIIDGHKLREATKLVEIMQFYSDLLLDPEVQARIISNAKTPMDIKFIMDAYKTMADRLNVATRLDTLDGNGTAARLNLAVSYQAPDGTSVQVGIKT